MMMMVLVTTERMFTMENARMAAKRCTAGESLMMSRCVPDRKMMRVIMSWCITNQKTLNNQGECDLKNSVQLVMDMLMNA